MKTSELKRQKKSEQYREKLAYSWENINLNQLAIDVVCYSSIGLDPNQDNHINLIPYKNNASNKYDISFIIGYRGHEIKVKKYGLDIPDNVVVELVYANDKFKEFKKDKNHKIDSYEFEIVSSFDRGELVGGFYYHEYFNNPEKNRIKTMSKKDIEKRKPDNASPEFWGGEKDKWENNQKVGKEIIEGWYDEMCYKTVFRAAYNSIAIDSEKIDEHYLKVIYEERGRLDERVISAIKQNANKEAIGFDEATQPAPAEIIPAPVQTVTPAPEPVKQPAKAVQQQLVSEDKNPWD